MTGAQQVIDGVRFLYGLTNSTLAAEEWSTLTEVPIKVNGWPARRLDALVLRNWCGKPKGNERHAIEVKVSRGDFLRELANPEKYAAAVEVAHRFYFAAPPGRYPPNRTPSGRRPDRGRGRVAPRSRRAGETPRAWPHPRRTGAGVRPPREPRRRVRPAPRNGAPPRQPRGGPR